MDAYDKFLLFIFIKIEVWLWKFKGGGCHEGIKKSLIINDVYKRKWGIKKVKIKKFACYSPYVFLNSYN